MAPKVAKVTATTPAAEEPAAKKAKVDEPAEEEEKYQEPDAPRDNRPALKEKIVFETADTTLNVVPTLGGKMLNVLTEGGMAYLLAGARANVAQKAGRYMFEAKVVQTAATQGKLALRIGFSTSSSGLVLGEDASSVYFDSEGQFCAAKKKTNVKNGRFGKDQVVAVVLNLDSKSPNANTIALYRDGALVGEPMPLPEDLKGQPLCPHVTFRSASVHVNFGDVLKPLPFKCRTFTGAAASDVSVGPSKQPKDGKFDVVMPIAFPDEGTFDWLDSFIQKNPQYVELSDRKIVQWAQASGHHQKGNWKVSNDKPALNTGIQELDNMSARKVISAIAPAIPRNYLIMEVKSNLVAAERKEVLKKFNYPCYKKTAKVVMGEPNKEFKATVQEKLLKEKQVKADQQFKAKKAEALRKKAADLRKKEAEKKRKEAEKKRAEEKRKKEIEEKKAKGEEVEEEAPAAEEEPEDEKVEEDEEMEAPQVELTDEEKQQNFIAKDTKDLTDQVMSSSYAKFTTPAKDEGFDDIQYEWQREAKAEKYLKDWVMKKKLTTKIDDIKPGKDFHEKKAAFFKSVKEWKDKLAAFKAGGAKKVAKKGDEDDEAVDIFTVTDVCNIGNGAPLFEDFTFEDWELLGLRFMFVWLCISFKVDCKDDDRVGIPLDHLGFYFNKYYSKPIMHKTYGVSTNEELLALIKDSIQIKDGLVLSQISDDLDSLDIFVKLTEEHRRERQRRIDAGDESGRLKFTPPPEPKPQPKPQPKPEAKPAAKPADPKAAAKPAAKAPEPKATLPGATLAAKGGAKGKGKGGGKW